MNKKPIFFIVMCGVVILGVGFFYWQTQRQARYAKTQEIFAPIYAYSGKLTPEQQKSFSDFIFSITEEVEPSTARKYALPKRERLKMEAHTMTLYRNNPELLFMGHGPLPIDTDVKPFQRNYSILALIAKTKLSDLPTSDRSKILQHLEALTQRLTKNSVEMYMKRIKDMPPGTSQKLPTMAFGIASHWRSGESQPIFEEDGSVTLPKENKRGIIHLTDTYENEYTVDLDAPTDTAITENTDELYAKIDRLFEQLTDQEFQRLSALSKRERSAEIEKLFSSE